MTGHPYQGFNHFHGTHQTQAHPENNPLTPINSPAPFGLPKSMPRASDLMSYYTPTILDDTKQKIPQRNGVEGPANTRNEKVNQFGRYPPSNYKHYCDSAMNFQRSFTIEQELMQIAPLSEFMTSLIFNTIIYDKSIKKLLLVNPAYLPLPLPTQITNISVVGPSSLLDSIWRLYRPFQPADNWLREPSNLQISYSEVSRNEKRAYPSKKGFRKHLKRFYKKSKLDTSYDSELLPAHHKTKLLSAFTINLYEGSLFDQDSRLACHDLLVLASIPNNKIDLLTKAIFAYYTPKYVLIGASADGSWDTKHGLWDTWAAAIVEKYPYQYFSKTERMGIFKCKYGPAKPRTREVFEWTFSMTIVDKNEDADEGNFSQ